MIDLAISNLERKEKNAHCWRCLHYSIAVQVCNNGQKLIDEGHADADEFSNLIEELLDNWQTLKDAMDERRVKLLSSERAQQYLFDAGEAEAWMSEQELYMVRLVVDLFSFSFSLISFD